MFGVALQLVQFRLARRETPAWSKRQVCLRGRTSVATVAQRQQTHVQSAKMDSSNRKPASTYINNLLLARGLLRDDQLIDFANPSRGEGGKDKQLGRIISLVHDLILKRDVGGYYIKELRGKTAHQFNRAIKSTSREPPSRHATAAIPRTDKPRRSRNYRPKMPILHASSPSHSRKNALRALPYEPPNRLPAAYGTNCRD